MVRDAATAVQKSPDPILGAKEPVHKGAFPRILAGATASLIGLASKWCPTGCVQVSWGFRVPRRQESFPILEDCGEMWLPRSNSVWNHGTMRTSPAGADRQSQSWSSYQDTDGDGDANSRYKMVDVLIFVAEACPTSGVNTSSP